MRGFVYMGNLGPVAYTASEMIWIRYFNPLEEHAGLSPMAPLRLSVDMGIDATRFNRNFFKNSAQPDLIFTTEETMSDEEVEVDEFYERWEKRYKGPGNAHRPAIANFIKDIKTLGMSHREMEFIQGLRWSLEDVSRTYGVPMPLLSDFQRATFSNVNAAERLFWRNTMIPEMVLLEEQLNQKLLPPPGLPQSTFGVRPELGGSPSRGPDGPGRPGREAPRPRGPHHQRSPPPPQPPRRPLGRRARGEVTESPFSLYGGRLGWG